VFEPLDAIGVAPTGDHGGNVQGRIIQVEKPLLGHHLRPLKLQILCSMGSRKRPGVNPPGIGYCGSRRGNENRRVNSFLGVEMTRPLPA
jgi:hypothetical protein